MERRYKFYRRDDVIPEAVGCPRTPEHAARSHFPGILGFKTTVVAPCARSIVAFDDIAPEDLNHHREPRGSRSSRFSTLRLISMYSMPSAQPLKDVTVAVDVDPYQLL